MKKIGIMLLCCLTGCISNSGSGSNNSYDAYAGAPYGQPVQYAAQPDMYYSEPMEYMQPDMYSAAPVIYETQPVEYGMPPMEYDAQPTVQQAVYPEQMPESMQYLPESPYDIGPYSSLYPASYNTSAAPADDSHTNHYPPALPKSRPYRRPIQ
ncbi:MAG: hypothetical protein IKN71_01915 [Alphaproteobacteria bacterium]|nr:hypothetical protein [Alphaproteobacteria bacterium]